MNDRVGTSIIDTQPRFGTLWDGSTRPSPADMRSEAYDRFEPASETTEKLLICAAPRTSSTRLSRLLLAAGIGIPMEYFNPHNFISLSTRWNLPTHPTKRRWRQTPSIVPDQTYVEALLKRRSHNGVFAANLQFLQIRPLAPETRHQLFDRAHVVYIVRADATAQVASLAAAILTRRFGFDAVDRTEKYSYRQMREAVKKALEVISIEEGGWKSLFATHGLVPTVCHSSEINLNPRHAVSTLARILGRQIDSQGLDHMIEIDSEYTADKALKKDLREMVRGLSDDASH